MRGVARPITTGRAMVAVAVFAVLLGSIRAAYRPSTHGVFAIVVMIPKSDHVHGIMEGHARRIVSPAILDAASNASGASPGRRPIRLVRGDEVVDGSSGPIAYATVSSVEDGDISLMVAAPTAEEAEAVAAAIVAAYARDQGPGRVATAIGGFSEFEATTGLLDQPWQAIAAVGLSILVAAAILVAPVPRSATGGGA